MQCALCAGPYKLEEHRCGVNDCQMGLGKICTHVTAACANCKGNHQATSAKCPARQKAKREAKKIKSDKTEKKGGKAPEQHNEVGENPLEEAEEGEIDMDMENNDRAKSPTSPLSNCGRGYESTIAALETATSIGAGMVCLQEPFIISLIAHSIFIGQGE